MATEALKDIPEKKTPLDLYAADEGDSDEMEIQEEPKNQNYDFQIDEQDDMDDNKSEGMQQMTKEEEHSIHQQMLFNIQGVGSIKNIQGYDVYVKHPQCEHSLTDIYRCLKTDYAGYPIIKLTLADWRFLQNDLIPLLIFHKQDKKLSFMTCMLMVQLTEVPQIGDQGVNEAAFDKHWINPKSAHRHKMFEGLRAYKEAFLQPQVINVLMEHLADCLQIEERNEKHEQMIELIIVLFKQLLQIPDAKSGQTNTQFAGKDLQKQLIMMFSAESVLDSFNYLSQDFSQPLNKKLCLQILEIQYQILGNFTPEQIFMTEEKATEAKKELYANENDIERRRMFLRSTRNGKFGTQLQITRPDGSKQMVNNIYQKSFETNNIGKKQRQKSNAVHGKNNKQNFIKADNQLINNATMQESDKKLLGIIRDFLNDMLENAIYNALINEVFNQINKVGSEMTLADFDNYHFFKFSTFMIEVQRMKAQQEYKSLQRQAITKAKENQNSNAANDGGKSLFDVKGSKAKTQKLQIEKVPFKINISQIGASLQLHNLEFMTSQMFKKIKTQKKSECKINDKEFHSSLQMMVQFLYVVRDMASSDDERNQRNAKILQGNIFQYDLTSIAQYAIKMFDHKKHNFQFLRDTLEFTHIMHEMLDEYSKGKVLTIQTQKKRKVKKNKKKAKKQGGELDEFAEELDYSDDNEFESEDEEEEVVERQFNFVSELAVLVDYDVIAKYVYVLQNEDEYTKTPMLIKECTTFFRRIINQTKQTWIFFQIEFLSIFNEFNQKGETTNSLMKGLMTQTAHTPKQKMLQAYSTEMKAVINQVTAKLTELMKQNQMLGVELLFRFQSREIKDQILSNYDGSGNTRQQQRNGVPAPMEDIQEAVIDMNAFNHEPEAPEADRDSTKEEADEAEGAEAKYHWTQEKDELLINNYPNFVSLGKKACFEMLAMLLPGTTARMCYNRGKLLKLKKVSAEEAMGLSKQLLSETHSNLNDKKVVIALQKFVLAKLEQEPEISLEEVKAYLKYIEDIYKEYSEFRVTEDNMVLFGGELELNDIKRQATGSTAAHMQTPFVIVPLTRNDFTKLSDASFLKLMACFGINVNQPGQVYPRIDANVNKDEFKKSLDQMAETLNQFSENGMIFHETVANFRVL